jgi:hypothetical protein
LEEERAKLKWKKKEKMRGRKERKNERKKREKKREGMQLAALELNAQLTGESKCKVMVFMLPDKRKRNSLAVDRNIIHLPSIPIAPRCGYILGPQTQGYRKPHFPTY